MLAITRTLARRGTRNATASFVSAPRGSPFSSSAPLTTRALTRPLQSHLPSSRLARMSASTGSTSRSLATVAPSTTNAHTAALNPLEALPQGYQVKTTIGDAPSASPYAVFDKPLETSLLDDRAYRLIRLQNGLEALLIHDAETDKSSAAMDVRVGHLSDPEELQGLAHFCEHLLFMGTEKYPRENEYSEYLSHHSGSSNAYTGLENTNYFFDVGHAHLEGALDRFAQFFLQPLFDPSCSEREIRAVDSEHKKNLQSDAWRAFQLEKSLSDPKHPYSHFGTGNAKTLWDDPKARGVDVRDELLKFHDRYYSANVMKLVVLGRESLDELTRSVVDKFSGVRNKGLAAPTFPSSPLGEEQLQTQVFFRTVKDIRLLDVTFPIPDQSPQFRSKPGQILSHFIGHEGQGSILSYLKAKRWANHLSAGATNGADGFEFFKISVDLTQEGLANYEKVVAAIFRYIELLKSQQIPEWSFKEVQQLCELAFRFKEKTPPSSYASGLSSQMQLPYPRDWILSGPYLTRDFDLDLIRSTAACLRPENCRVSIAAQQLPDGSQAWDLRERWYGTEYKIGPIPRQVIEDAKRADAAAFEGMALPKPNDFIPSTFEVQGKPDRALDRIKPTKRPMLAHKSDLSMLWHKKDDNFFLPKANVFLLIRSPLIDATPSNAVKCRIFAELVKDALTEYSYDAELAGLGYNIESQADGIGLAVDGYNDKLAVLCRYVLEAVAKFKVDPRRFDIIKDQVKRAYQNFQLESPYQHANYYMTYVTVERMWTAQDKLKELDELEADDVQRFLPDLLGRMHLEMLVHGNLSRTEAKDLLKMAEDILKPKALAPAELISHRSLLLPPGSNHSLTVPVPNDKNVNSSIEHYCQIGDPTDVPLRATLSMLAQIASEPVFDQLRTKEQLGYLVFSSVRKTIGSMGFRILVQSERESAYLESRIEEFYRTTFSDLLRNMSEQDFLDQRESLIQKKLEVVKNLGEESSRYWFHIHSGYYDFLQRDVDVDALRRVTKEDVVRVFEQFIHPEKARERAKVCVHVQSQVKQARFSAEATDALAQTYRNNGLGAVLESDEVKQAVEVMRAQQPLVAVVKESTEALLKSSGASEQVAGKIIKAVDDLAKAHPVRDSDVLESAGPKAEVIDDVIRFKAGLTPSKAAQPMRSWKEYMEEPTSGEMPSKSAPQVTPKPVSANL
ncbi:hypothetical protein FA10DRAFT_249471 [Acaromyces ingoldii]|uniref:Uncharacterized protein n=1 Tax=Acaromyces ingoldii TaxID=215250 RepID=A0A316YP14_9BASI|nr:hypothetical protein FA10DRAFT_249471 [Acaromyces ingoldii]PWN91280.1 hypothetical protein FA10DRAFT_249471 [Acaromyces ingoldii]